MNFFGEYAAGLLHTLAALFCTLDLSQMPCGSSFWPEWLIAAACIPRVSL